MQKLEEKVLIARWKSYMTFKHSGDVRRYTPYYYKEIHVMDDRTLTVREYNNDRPKTVLSTNEWSLNFFNKKHYLDIAAYKLTFEIITVNHVVLVLLETVSGEKTFYAKENTWKKYIQFNKEKTM
jgi:hypothetical protein